MSSRNLALMQLLDDLTSKVLDFTNESLTDDAERFQLREGIRTMAKMIVHVVDGPEHSVKTVARGYTSCSALKICLDLNLAGTLDAVKPASMVELASATGTNVQILQPVMRLLAHDGIFKQTEDGLWHHTEMSVALTQPSFRANLDFNLKEYYHAVAHLPQFLEDTAYRAPSPRNTAFNDLYQTPLDFYHYSDLQGKESAMKFGTSMEDLAKSQLPFFDKCYPIEKIAQHSHFIDVAGGFGCLSYFLANKLPRAKFLVQDQPFIVEQATKLCAPELCERVQFQVHDMLSPQPEFDRTAVSALVFLLKVILHDHSDEDCKTIIRNLLSSMVEGDRIIIIDTVVPEKGAGSLSSSMSDMILLSFFGTSHRTLKQFRDLIYDCGENLMVGSFTGGVEEFDGMIVIEVQKKPRTNNS